MRTKWYRRPRMINERAQHGKNSKCLVRKTVPPGISRVCSELAGGTVFKLGTFAGAMSKQDWIIT